MSSTAANTRVVTLREVEPLSQEQVERVVAIALDLAREGRTEELVEFFDHGLSVDVRDSGGNTAVMLAAYHGRTATVRALVERGVDIDLRNAHDQTPIAGALFKGHDEIVTMLRAAGADLDAGTPSARAAAKLFARTELLE